MKLFTHPFSDTFSQRDWAQDPVFKGYLALIPRYTPHGAAEIRLAHQQRLDNTYQVLDCALEDLRAERKGIRGRTRHAKSARREIDRRIARLERIRKSRITLPSFILVKAKTIEAVIERTGSGTFVRRTAIDDCTPGWIHVEIGDIQEGGMAYAIRQAASRRAARYMRVVVSGKGRLI